MNPCIYCMNRERDVCSPCQEEGKYRNLAPELLEYHEIPELLPYYKLMEMDNWQARACFYLALFYLQQKAYY